MLTKIILIRHGQTDWNAEKKYCGFSDLGLNKQGKQQIGKLSRRLKNEDIYKVYSSDLKRAVQSAGIIFKKTKIEKIWDLREIDFGILEGKSHKEILEIEPRIYQDWLNDPYSITIPKGESLNKFKKRVMKAFKEIILLNQEKTTCGERPLTSFRTALSELSPSTLLGASPEPVKGRSESNGRSRTTCGEFFDFARDGELVESRSRTIALVCHGGTISVILNSISKSKNFWELIPASASMNIIEYKGQKPKITLFNDTAHLNG